MSKIHFIHKLQCFPVGSIALGSHKLSQVHDVIKSNSEIYLSVKESAMKRC